MIRNAFQHTQHGIVTVKQSKMCIIIANENIRVNTNDTETTEAELDAQNDLGFGLGLELTERLVKHYGWQYTNIAKSNGHYVEINFKLKEE